MLGVGREREFLSFLFSTAVRAADPDSLMAMHLPPPPKGRVIVVGAGKAARQMARAFEHVWNRPCEGVVVARTPIAEIIHYKPRTASVHKIPVVIIPAWIMKYYILDLSPSNSLIRYLLEQGFSVFIVSWKNPTAADRNIGFDDYRIHGVKAAIDAARAIGSRMRLFVSGSAPLPAQVLEDFRERFGHTILERYGMTETLMNISNPYAGERRPGSVGQPLPGVSVRLSDSGEVLLKGPNVFAGYWRRDDATEAAFDNGWFKSGDIASLSEDGYYTLSGRRSDLIISGGFNIYPREIEEFLSEQPEIAEAAVVGEKDRVRGEIPVAYVVPSGNIDLAEIEARCRAKLASFKIPRRFETIEKLPRNALGKVQKHLLCRAS